MTDWDKDNVKPRQDAIAAFVTKLHNEPETRAACLKDGAVAKTLLADLGGFYVEGDAARTQPDDGTPRIKPIPKDTAFHVFEKEKTDLRDKFVMIVLPDEPDQALPAIDPTKVWVCTWAPYDQGA